MKNKLLLSVACLSVAFSVSKVDAFVVAYDKDSAAKLSENYNNSRVVEIVAKSMQAKEGETSKGLKSEALKDVPEAIIEAVKEALTDACVLSEDPKAILANLKKVTAQLKLGDALKNSETVKLMNTLASGKEVKKDEPVNQEVDLQTSKTQETDKLAAFEKSVNEAQLPAEEAAKKAGDKFVEELKGLTEQKTKLLAEIEAAKKAVAGAQKVEDIKSEDFNDKVEALKTAAKALSDSIKRATMTVADYAAKIKDELKSSYDSATRTATESNKVSADLKAEEAKLKAAYELAVKNVDEEAKKAEAASKDAIAAHKTTFEAAGKTFTEEAKKLVDAKTAADNTAKELETKKNSLTAELAKQADILTELSKKIEPLEDTVKADLSTKLDKLKKVKIDELTNTVKAANKSEDLDAANNFVKALSELKAKVEKAEAEAKAKAEAEGEVAIVNAALEIDLTKETEEGRAAVAERVLAAKPVELED